MAKPLSAGTRVKVKEPGSVPQWSTWDCDGHRTSTSVKKRLQQMFFRGDRRVSAQIVYISSEAERDKLRRIGRIKVELRDAAGAALVVTAEVQNIVAA